MEPRDLLLLATVVLCLATGATANVIPQSEDLYADNPGLYNASDSVITLTEVSFKPSVLYSKRAWLVEFYNSWCGFCQRFAPMWKAVAKSAHGKSVIMVATATISFYCMSLLVEIFTFVECFDCTVL